MSVMREMAWLTTISVPALSGDEKFVRLTGLPESRKKEAWKMIIAERPALAELLRSPDLQAMVAFFDAEIFVESEVVPSLPSEPLKGRARAEA
ncbi:hypothetical protein [Pseudomonas nitroreducens]|uniref:hypothetical protein n=1 Tax=Pseudomonas nitroreducens TaxID=46680 RepID=UPI00351CFE02